MEIKQTRMIVIRKFVLAFLFGMAIGALFLGIEAVGGDSLFKPFPDWDRLSVAWKSATEHQTTNHFCNCKIITRD